MSLTGQILPLAGVVIGAVLSFLVTGLNERTRWRRQQAVRWDEARLAAYVEYAHAVKELAARYQRIAVGRGLTAGSLPLELTGEVLDGIRAADSHRSALSDKLELLGDTAANTAAKRLNHCLWHLEYLAQGLPTAGGQDWDQAYAEFRAARRQYLDHARASLGVDGPAVGEAAAWPPAWRTDGSPAG
ncbi:hypothetical protein ABZ532_07625 [Streptomyces sp. NPDC019396]|uniref:hypothetical protein n=1 Tax=Streptomyces sp. NPDC019396 TaxID=3154687 RepID=UPI0033F50D33